MGQSSSSTRGRTTNTTNTSSSEHSEEEPIGVLPGDPPPPELLNPWFRLPTAHPELAELAVERLLYENSSKAYCHFRLRNVSENELILRLDDLDHAVRVNVAGFLMSPVREYSIRERERRERVVTTLSSDLKDLFVSSPESFYRIPPNEELHYFAGSKSAGFCREQLERIQSNHRRDRERGQCCRYVWCSLNGVLEGFVGDVNSSDSTFLADCRWGGSGGVQILTDLVIPMPVKWGVMQEGSVIL